MQASGYSSADIKKFIDGAMVGLARAPIPTPAGPITPGHSKFTPAELQQHADQSVDAATNDTMDAQGDLIRTVQTGVAAGELAAAPAAVRAVPAVLRGAGNVVKAVGSRIGTVRDIGMAATGSQGALARLATRAAGALSGAAEETAPFATPAPIASSVEGVQPGSSALSRAASPAPDIMPTTRDGAQSALEKLLQKNLDEGAVGETIKGYPISGDPPSNPDLMQRIVESLQRAKAARPAFRPTGGPSSGASVAAALRAQRSPQ